MSDTHFSPSLWELLCERRVLDAADPLAVRFHKELKPGDKHLYEFRTIHLSRCRDFADVSQQFNQALFQRKAFGKNPDALHDLLTDLPDGSRYVFEVYGMKSLTTVSDLKLRPALSRRVGGTGYGTGQAVFLLHK